jgi:6-phosphogluconolactonase (cycloisomerase 2 family)
MTNAAFYQSIGPELIHHDVDVDAGTLTRRGSVTLPSKVQYVWQHPTKPFLYVSTSDAASGNTPNPGVMHRLCAVKMAPDGSLSLHGEPAVLPNRPIHHSVNPAGTHALTAFNTPSRITVHAINADGTVGALVEQKAAVNVGIYAHQVVVAPSNNIVIFPARGNDARGGKAEDPGAIKVYRFDNGQVSDAQNIIGGNNGFDYRPRHVDFHPTKPWMYANIESQNEVHMHSIAGDVLSAKPLFVKTSLAAAHDPKLHQTTSAIHVHPNGRFVYVGNRADGMTDFNGHKVFAGGENSIAVFSIDQTTGEHTRIQSVDPLTHHVRTLGIHPDGKLLIAASIREMNVRAGDNVRVAPAGLSVFRIRDDGKLELLRKYDVELNGALQWWAGFAVLRS